MLGIKEAALLRKLPYTQQRLYFVQCTAGYKLLLDKIVEHFDIKQYREYRDYDNRLTIEEASHTDECPKESIVYVVKQASKDLKIHEDFLDYEIYRASRKTIKRQRNEIPYRDTLPIYVSSDANRLPDGF